MEVLTFNPPRSATWSSLPRPIGWVDGITGEPGQWVLWGWALPERGKAYDAFRVLWNSEPRGLAEPIRRPEVAEAVPWVRHAPDGGFLVRLNPGDDAGRLDVICERGGTAVGRLSTTFLAPERDQVPLPPVELAERVSGMSGDAFRLSGLKAYTDLWDALRQHAPDPAGLRILDWGCGCGRITRYLAAAGVLELRGCDIDAEAIAWCRRNLEGTFSVNAPEPPLPYADGELDVVVASSVFTHLARGHQEMWLRELQRILAPGGLLLASVSGETAFLQGTERRPWRGRSGSLRHQADFFRRRRRLHQARILDDQRDPWLDGIAPADYYRLVYQSRQFTVDAWSTSFEVLDYVERGYHGHQDLVVMRSRGPGAPA